MEKATVNLTNWQLYVYDGRYNLAGQCDYHPILGKNSYVAQTTSLVHYDYDEAEKVLLYETENTLYSCPLKYLSPYPYRNVIAGYKMELTRLYNDEASILDKIISTMARISIRQDIEEGRKESYKKYKPGKKDLFIGEIETLISQGQGELKEKEQQRHEQLIAEAKKYEDCVYIEIAQLEHGDLLAYHIGTRTGVLKPRFHSGMFQDSIYYVEELDSDGKHEYVDFRYFPRGFGLADTYRWSDNIKQAVLKNDSERAICFNDVKIMMGETVVIKPKPKNIPVG